MRQTWNITSKHCDTAPLNTNIGELMQQQRRRVRKRHLKMGIRLTSNFIALNQLRSMRQMLTIFSGVLYRSSGKEYLRKSLSCVLTSSTKPEFRHFHVVVVQWRQRNLQKSVMHVQSCCFANLQLLLFSRSRWRHRSLSSLSGTLSNDDGGENVPKKMNLRSFKLNRVYLDPLNMSNTGDFSWSWILKDFVQVQKQEGKFVVVCPRPP